MTAPSAEPTPASAWRKAPPWPAPAFLSWGASWALLRLLGGQAWSPLAALVVAAAIGVVLSVWGSNWWRKLVIAGGFPVSFALSAQLLGHGDVPSWVWLLPLAVMLLVYPVNAWSDAPLFPTPAKALLELPRFAPLPVGAKVVDAGCGLGHGLRALRSAYPQVQFYGLEWSVVLRWWCALRLPCPDRCGDRMRRQQALPDPQGRGQARQYADREGARLAETRCRINPNSPIFLPFLLPKQGVLTGFPDTILTCNGAKIEAG